jgi:GTP-binding protein
MVRFELKMIADVGLIGLPNVGKSSWLNTLTNAKSKVANYQFTTLEPHLGVYYELILADIPGLIEGAHEGKGLGIKFLRHIERTNVLFHFISAESEDPKKDYDTIRKELAKYNPKLAEKEEYVFLSKKDMLPEKEAAAKAEKLSKKIKKEVIPVSVIDDGDIKKIQRILNGIKDEKNTRS